jgi:hypothetical protein
MLWIIAVDGRLRPLRNRLTFRSDFSRAFDAFW